MSRNYAVESISSLPFGDLIGGPMLAAIEAQGQAAKATVDFILEVGFVPDPAGQEDPFFDDTNDEPTATPNIGSVREITFKYNVNDEVGSTEASLTVPLLTVVPIPYIAIDEMTIDFMAKISEALLSKKTKATTLAAKTSTKAKAGWGPYSASLRGSYSAKHSSTAATTSKYQTDLTMNVHVKASQSDMPKGLEKILQILSDIIRETNRSSAGGGTGSGTGSGPGP